MKIDENRVYFKNLYCNDIYMKKKFIFNFQVKF